MTSSQPTIWHSSNSHQSEFGCVLMSPRPSDDDGDDDLLGAILGCRGRMAGSMRAGGFRAVTSEAPSASYPRRRCCGRVLTRRILWADHVPARQGKHNETGSTAQPVLAQLGKLLEA